LTPSTISAGVDPAGSAAILAAVRFGLCDTCRHQRLVPNTRGSVFSLCERSRTEPEFPRYPRIPVLECRGYEPNGTGAEDERGGVDRPP
jgi:hypothetical protein